MVASSGMRFSAQTSRTNTSLRRGRGGRGAEGGSGTTVVAGDSARRLDMVCGGSVELPLPCGGGFKMDLGGGFDADAKQESSRVRLEHKIPQI